MPLLSGRCIEVIQILLILLSRTSYSCSTATLTLSLFVPSSPSLSLFVLTSLYLFVPTFLSFFLIYSLDSIYAIKIRCSESITSLLWVPLLYFCPPLSLQLQFSRKPRLSSHIYQSGPWIFKSSLWLNFLRQPKVQLAWTNRQEGISISSSQATPKGWECCNS